MFNFRPEHESEYWITKDDDDNEGWADNAVSNSLAYLSQMVVPTWCKDKDHWTIKLMNYFWADCGCCLFLRGVMLGYLLGALVGAFATATIAWLFF